MNKRRIFSRADWLCGLGAFLVSLAVYVYTAAPNVTLLDSGEFLVAAGHFGVPHPTGYPLWTLTSWLFQLLPLGNMAWEVAVWSGVCTAGAVGIAAMMGNNILRWMGFFGEPRQRWANIVISCSFALTLAFSFSVWSQAVIAEVYGLHALMTAVFLLLLYRWVHGPQRDSLMIGAFFVLALSFGNHHLTLVLSPLPFLLILLLRRRAFWDWLLAAMVTALLVYLGFAILSGDVLVLKTAIRLAYCVAFGGAFLLWKRRLRIRIKLIAFLPFAVIAGLLSYAYMPLASSTNPPMNWSYAREPQGFFYSVNRSQYQGPLTEQSIKTLGRFMGTYPGGPSKPRAAEGERSKREVLVEWAGFFWLQLNRSFTPFSIIFYFCSILAALRLSLNRRTWIYLLHIAFVLAAFLQPILDGAVIDAAGWWLQMPYHTYTNLIFALLCVMGGGYLLDALTRKRAKLLWITALLPLMPLYGFVVNFSEASQRNHWFGWMFGYDMLKDLPKGSIVIGGSDPGRFVPTYMIFGESPQPAALKRDPGFDRRDLYIITQNALGESNYMKYLRDHYTTARPKPKNAFEKWLGRENTYPQTPIILPSPEECDVITKETAKDAPEESKADYAFEVGAVLKWIWEKNKDKHDFFIEESFPITWTYDYAIPHGLVYQLSKTKLDRIPPEAVTRDFAFWKDYKAKLLNDPAYASDYDAQRSFSKLRQTMGNIYKYRKMNDEAIRAYFEALELWPENIEVIATLTRLLWDKGDFDTSIPLFQKALEKDYNNLPLWRLAIMAEERKKTEGEIQGLKDTLSQQPRNREIIDKLIELYSRVGESEKAEAIVKKGTNDLADDPAMLRIAVTYYGVNDKWQDALAPAERLIKVEPTNAQNWLLLARVYYSLNKKKEFYETARKAIEIGGVSMREQILNDDFFKSWRDEPEFQNLAQPGGNISPGGGVPPSSKDQPATSSTDGQEHMMLRSP
ncbi:hypothetical protein DB345_20530 [Spartobacteria bacterium LR76]|nr:hypothetical protein DB345_20530 [Spartobacteria bacterium LR76]